MITITTNVDRFQEGFRGYGMNLTRTVAIGGQLGYKKGRSTFAAAVDIHCQGAIYNHWVHWLYNLDFLN